MITPSFNLTATERVLPKLALDFTTASLDSRITFTRTTGASNPATFVGSNGYVTSASNDQPRFDYDPVTLACKGLLIEESRTNNFTNSSNFNSWTKSNMSVSTGAITAPDNTSTGDKLIPNTTNTDHLINQLKTLTAITYTNSVYAKKGEYNFIVLYGISFANAKAFFNLNTGAVGSVTGTGSPVAKITNCGNGWYRCELSFTASASNVAYGYSTANANGVTFFAGDGTSGVYIWGAQLEAGTFATSYIPTTTAALTRNADVAMMTGTNFSNWYNAGTGAFNCAVLPKSATGTKPVLQFDDATALNTIAMQGNATAVELKITTLAILQSTLSTGTITANTVYGGCGAWTSGSNALSKSGGDATTGSPVSIPTVTQSRLGSDGTNYFNGWLQKINYWPQRLTNSEVQAFSK